MIIKSATRFAFATGCLTAIAALHVAHAQMGGTAPGSYGPPPGAYGLPARRVWPPARNLYPAEPVMFRCTGYWRQRDIEPASSFGARGLSVLSAADGRPIWS